MSSGSVLTTEDEALRHSNQKQELFSSLFLFAFPSLPQEGLFVGANLVQLTQEVQEAGHVSPAGGESPAWGRARREGGVFVADQWMLRGRPARHRSWPSPPGARAQRFGKKGF